jgi:hypothetical protein
LLPRGEGESDLRGTTPSPAPLASYSLDAAKDTSRARAMQAAGDEADCESDAEPATDAPSGSIDAGTAVVVPPNLGSASASDFTRAARGDCAERAPSRQVAVCILCRPRETKPIASRMRNRRLMLRAGPSTPVRQTSVKGALVVVPPNLGSASASDFTRAARGDCAERAPSRRSRLRVGCGTGD